MATEQLNNTQDARSDETLQEIRRRLISIHYELAEGPHGDRELQRRTRERLMDLMRYVNDVIESPPASSGARSVQPQPQDC